MKFISREKNNLTYEMNISERTTITECLEEVINCMEWDEQECEYRDNGNFLLALSNIDMQNLKEILQKL